MTKNNCIFQLGESLSVCTRSRALTLTVLAGSIALLGATPALAEPMLQYASLYRNPDMSRWTDNYVELGVGYNSKDSYRFGEWSGLREEGAFPIVGLNWLSRDRGNDANYWAVHAAGLGLETRKLAIEGGRQGSWVVAASADRLVRSELDTARFVHPTGLGSSSLSGLTANVAANTPTRPYNIEQGRDFYRLGLTTTINKEWGFNVNYREDVRDGNRVTGIRFSLGGFRGYNVPYEIDDHTQQLETLLAYTGKDAQLQLGYTYSRYENNLDAFIVQNPGSIGQIGRMGLMPSNDYHQLHATGAYNFGKSTRLTTKLSYGVAAQDEAFLPYNFAGVMPSRTSLDGEVIKTQADVTLITRPSEKSSLKLGYQYNDHDNRTPRSDFRYAGADGAQGAANTAFDRRNVPISNTEHKYLVDGDYQLGMSTVLRGLLEYKQVKYTLTDRTETETSKAGLEVRKPLFEQFLGSLGYSYTQRTGSSYDKNTFFRESYFSPTFQSATELNAHPSLRSYLYSDFNENRVRASGNWAIGETLSLQTGVDGYYQKYRGPDCDTVVDPLAAGGISGTLSATCLGRNLAKGGSASIDLQWQPEENLAAFTFLNYAETSTDQTGRVWTRNNANSTNEAQNWFAALTYLDQTAGVGAKWQPNELWDVGGQYVYSYGEGKTGIATGANLTSSPVPDTTMIRHAVQLYAKWNFNRKTTIRFNYLYESLRSNDWAYDGLTPTSSVNNVLLTGQTSPKYENHVIGVSVAMHSW